jgi:DNA-binding transcriptional ArsR family regulator
MMNMKTETAEEKLSQLFQTLGQPARLQILQAIGDGEACVCHLEATLGLRQAFISQHLMVLRKAEVLQTRRAGRYIFYRVRDQKVLDLIRLSAEVTKVAEPMQLPEVRESFLLDCVCPTCSPAT